MITEFITACKNGNLYNILQLLAKTHIQIHFDHDYGFRLACLYGHLHIVDYLVNLYTIKYDYNKIDIHAYSELGFRWACQNGHIHIIEYLINLYKIKNTNYGKININSNPNGNNSGFQFACKHGHKHVVKYLNNLYKINMDYDKININIKSDSKLNTRWAFIHGHEYIIKYVINVYKYNHIFNPHIKYLSSCGNYLYDNKCIIVL